MLQYRQALEKSLADAMGGDYLGRGKESIGLCEKKMWVEFEE